MKIRYFAWLRERLDLAEEEVSPPLSVLTIADLIGWLKSRDAVAEAAFSNPRLIKAAIGTEIVAHSAPIAGATVIALFPPMTGG
jgi:molybdopterin synthase sulfur carrier subunit